MDWVTCPKCGFTQIPTEKCLRCGRPSAPADRETVAASPADGPPSSSTPAGDPARTVAMDRPARAVAVGRPRDAPPPAKPSAPSPAETIPAGTAPARSGGRGRGKAIVAAVGAAVVVGLVLLLTRGSQAPPPPAPESTSPSQTNTATLDLSGRWETEFSKTLPGPAPRPALKQAFLETDREGNILAAGVLLTDPGRGGAGAGYRLAGDGPQRLGQVASELAASPSGATLREIDFIPFPAWMPTRDRVWRALEGQSRRILDVRYVLLESVEDDYVVQAGINRSGFLSYAFFSRGYTRSRGLDALSGVIHPDPGSALTGFKNLVWDFSGAADFLTLAVHATLSGPEGGVPDRLTLIRKGAAEGKS
jgi:hypothetical protein